MTVQRSPLPRIPGISVELAFPRWVGGAVSLGVAFFVVAILVASWLATRGAGDSAFGSAMSSDLTWVSENDIAFTMTVSGHSPEWGPADSWSVLLRSGRVSPASSEVLLVGEDSTDVRVSVPLDGSFTLDDLVAIRWDPNGKLGTHYPLDHLTASN